MQNSPSLVKDPIPSFSSESVDNIAIVAAIEQKEERDVKAICIEKIMSTIMINYNQYLERHHPNLCREVQGIISALNLPRTVADYIFDSVAAKGQASEYWSVFQEVKSMVQPFAGSI